MEKEIYVFSTKIHFFHLPGSMQLIFIEGSSGPKQWLFWWKFSELFPLWARNRGQQWCCFGKKYTILKRRGRSRNALLFFREIATDGEKVPRSCVWSDRDNLCRGKNQIEDILSQIPFTFCFFNVNSKHFCARILSIQKCMCDKNKKSNIFTICCFHIG